MALRLLIAAACVFCTSSRSDAVLIGYFPGLPELVEKSDAIVILRIDKHISTAFSPTLYSTHECYVYQTLKGDIPSSKQIRLQLMDTRTEHSTPYALYSTHLMFLAKKRSPSEPTDYRTIGYEGAHVLLSPTGHEKLPSGDTLIEQIKSVLGRAFDYHAQQHAKNQTKLKEMLFTAHKPTEERLKVKAPGKNLFPSVIESLWEKTPTPDATPFDSDANRRRQYLNSFRNGYVWAKGVHLWCPTTPDEQNHHAIRGWVEGWKAGAEKEGQGDLPVQYARFVAWSKPAPQPPEHQPAEQE